MPEEIKMNYETFKAEYIQNFRQMMKYSPNEVGSGMYAEKLADMAEAHPEWAEQVENDA
jgi:hypothetical protein